MDLECCCEATTKDHDSPCAMCRLWTLWDKARALGRPRVFARKIGALKDTLKKYAALANYVTSYRLGCHAFRRGRAQDLVNRREGFSTILKMDGWKTPAILSYMAMDDLDDRNHALKQSEDSDSE